MKITVHVQENKFVVESDSLTADQINELTKHLEKRRPEIERDWERKWLEWADKKPLPRCKHGSCLYDGAGEKLEPPCGCRWPQGVQEK